MATLDRIALSTKIDAYITSNNNREITGAKLNELFQDIKESMWNLTDDGLPSGSSQTKISSGCNVAYSGTGLTFVGGPGSAVFAGTPVTVAGNNVTLAAADGTHPRIDAIILKSDGSFDKITGTPAATPSAPVLNDPVNEILRTYALVPQSATTPSGITTLTWYDENLGTGGGEDATFSTNDATNIDPDATTNPSNGTKCIEVSGPGGGSGKYFELTAASAIQKAVLSNISFNVYLGGTGVNKIFVYLRDSGGTNVASFTIQNGVNGYDKNLTGVQQNIIIDVNDFTWTGATEFDEIRFEWQTGGSPTFSFDEVWTQTGLPVVSTGPDVARLLPQADQVLTSSSNEVAWDVANNVRAYHNQTENTEIQIPDNFELGDQLSLTVEADGVSTLSWATGYSKIDGEEVDLDGSETDGDLYIYTLRVISASEILVILSGKTVAA